MSRGPKIISCPLEDRVLRSSVNKANVVGEHKYDRGLTEPGDSESGHGHVEGDRVTTVGDWGR